MPRIEGVAHALADQVEGAHREEDGQAGQRGSQLGHLGAKPLALGTSCLDAWFCHDGKTLPNR